MANPKHKISKERRDKRRTHWKLSAPALSKCPQCHSDKAPHRVCPTCGYYAGRSVIAVES